jgi:DNA-binding HxlR family transcriptional regulator
MALRRDYASQSCPVARSLEVVGERWTLLVVRDAFHGVRRFSDFHAHLGIPKAVLSERLTRLVANDVMVAVPGAGGKDCYELTPRGRSLWPTIWALITWGNDNFYEAESRRSYRHADCGGTIGPDRICDACQTIPEAGELIVHPPKKRRSTNDDPVAVALRKPHRLLEPLATRP